MQHQPLPARRSLQLAVILGIALLLLVALALSIGPVRISPADLLTGRLDEQQLTALLLLRLPRALLAILAGAALAVSGALMQTYFRNPLAEPYITGVSAGGALGAVLGEAMGLGPWLLALLTPLLGEESALAVSGRSAHAGSALLGAALITAALYAFALRGRRPGATATLLLGIALGTFCGAVVWFLLLLQGPGGAQQAMAWLLGRVSTVGFGDVYALLPALLIGGGLALYYSRDLDALLLGDEKAASLGVNLAAARRGILAAATLLSAVCVAFCGVIAFIGLMVPHVIRGHSGSVHRRLLPLSALGGAVLLLLTDIGARTLHPPGEIPLTVLTSLIGAPFFILILLRSKSTTALATLALPLLLLLSLPARAQEDEIDLDSIDEDAIVVTLDEGPVGHIDLGSDEVLGKRTLQDLLGQASAVTVIRAEELSGASSLAQILERVPGLDVKSDGGFGQLSVAQLRGARAQQVLVLVDGQPLSPGQVSDLSSLPVGMLERVEVVSGPEAARFGSGALGGVINLVTSGPGKADGAGKAKCDPRRPCNETAELEIGTGSNGLARIGYSQHYADRSFSLAHEQARNDYSFSRGTGDDAIRRNNDARQDTLWWRWRSGRTQWGAGARILRRGIPGAAEFPTLRASLSRETLWAQAGRDAWRADLQVEHSRFHDPEPYLGQRLEQEDTRVSMAWNYGSLAQRAGEWGVRPRLDYVDSLSYGQHTRAGLDLSRHWEHRDRDWTLNLDLGAIASSDVGVDPSLRLGASKRIDKQNRFYASAAYSVRHPDFSELYLSGGGAVQGNPDLDPERVGSGEIGLHSSFPSAQLKLAAFYSNYEDSILFLPVSSYLVRATNTGSARIAGAEALLDWQIRDSGRSASLPLTRRECWLRSSYTWLPMAEFASGTPLTARAQHHLNTRLEYSALDGAHPPGPGADPYGRGWRGAFSLDYSSELPADLFGNLVIEPRTLCGLELVRSLGRRELLLGVTNLFDVNTRDSWNYPQPGREFYVTLRSNL